MRVRLAVGLLWLLALGCGDKRDTPPSTPAAAAPAQATQAQAPTPLDPATDAAIDAELRRYDAALAAARARFTEAWNPTDEDWVRRKLAHMVEVDQLMRHSAMAGPFTGPAREEYWRRFGSRFREVDTAHAAELARLLEHYPWITADQFGPEASQGAWLIVQHADHDVAFQAMVLARLEPLAQRGAIRPADYAYLYDRVQVNRGRPQRYGTQGHCVDGTWEPRPLEEPERVDALRAEVGLEPLAEYRGGFVDACDDAPSMRELAEDAYQKQAYARCAELFAGALEEPRYAARAVRRDLAYDAACCSALAGHPDRAFALLETALEHGFDDLGHLERDPDLAALRRDRRWAALVARVRAGSP